MALVDLEEYVSELDAQYSSEANQEIADQQKAYMKEKFEFFGIKTPTRRRLQKPFLEKDYLPDRDQLFQLIKLLWEKPQRDFQLFGLDLAEKYRRVFEEEDIRCFEFMVTNKSWWDIVDLTATHLVGTYMRRFPHARNEYVERWMDSGNIWLQRVCLLFQLKYKEQLDRDLLESLIIRLTGSQEFFINKAIGWVLREYGKTAPEWVLDFVNSNELHSLSKREAIRKLV